MPWITHTTLATRSLPRRAVTTVVAGALLFGASTAHAKQTPEQKCQKGRYDAAAKYAACQQKVLAKRFGSFSNDAATRNAAFSKCRVSYAAVWPKLQKKARGTGGTCDRDRFADSVNGTVTDWLTGLQWEQKTDDASVHDKDSRYSWTSELFLTRANGPAFTTFLTTLNGGGCFAGQCDWRLPTLVELQTILSPYPCTTRPCIDPVFGPTVSETYWSATTVATDQQSAWLADLHNGSVTERFKSNVFSYVRAVRGGL